MEGQHGNDNTTSVHAVQSTNCETRGNTYRTIINAGLQKPKALDLQKLEIWYQEYANADGDTLGPTSTSIYKAQQDELHEVAIEACILELSGRISVRNGFCVDCQYLFDNWLDLSDSKAQRPSAGQNWPGTGADGMHAIVRNCHTLVLEAASRKGCKMCAFLLQMLKDCTMTDTISGVTFSALDTFRRVEARIQYLGATETASLSVQNWNAGPSQILWLNYPGKINNHSNSGIARYIKRYSEALDLSADVYSENQDVLDIARSWLRSCSRDHQQCRRSTQGSLPTRLISIANEKPHLVLTKGLVERPRYSTLSHRWVSEPFLKLTRQNFESLRVQIPTEKLTQTFRDAIEISRGLGLDYLWIDSLCIIQNDGKDWEHEAASMSSVYGNSFINIAAASARNINEGCFIKPPYFVSGLRARTTINGSSLVRDFRGYSEYHRSVTGSYLATRAWALQEKLLPARTIHFGDRGAFWECKANTANEFLPDGFPTILAMPTLLGASRRNFMIWWGQIVELYSAANLTFGKDKLPAISGVARSIYEEEGIQYLAGMWRDELEYQLCWVVVTPHKRPPKRAPSWSWASIDGGVKTTGTSRFNNNDDVFPDVYTHVVEAKMTYEDEDPFATVTGGLLRVTCTGLLPARLIREDTVKLQLNNTLSEDLGELQFKRDCLDNELEKDGDTVYLLPIFGGHTGSSHGRQSGEEDKDEEDDDGDDDDQEHGNNNRNQKSSQKDDENGESDEDDIEWIDEMAICGILLRKTDDGVGWFRRIGMFTLWEGIEEEEDLYKPFLSALELHGEDIARSICTEVVENTRHPAEKYVIYVV